MMPWAAAVHTLLPWRSPWKSPWKSSVKLQRVAKALAGETENMVRQRIGRQVVGMSRPEARGYIRARAALPVGRAVEKAFMRDRSLPLRSKALLQAMATEDVLRMVMRDLTQVPAVASVVRRAG